MTKFIRVAWCVAQGLSRLTSALPLGRVASYLAPVIALSGLLTGCRLSDTGHSSYLPAHRFFAVLQLEHRAMNLAMVSPYDTVMLHVTRVMGDGSSVPGEVVYSVSDPAITVTPGGVLKALAPVARAIVRVALTYGGITRSDSAIVSVIAGNPVVLRDFGMRLNAGDSAKVAFGSGNKTIPLIRESLSGSNLPGVLISLTASDTTKVKLKQFGNTNQVNTQAPGRAMLYARTFAYGRTWEDSLHFTVGWPLVAYIRGYRRIPSGQRTPVQDFSPGHITLARGACVVWINNVQNMDMDVKFSTPDSVIFPVAHISSCDLIFPQADSVGGDILSFRMGATDFWQIRLRAFPKAGVYPYTSARYGTSGSIRICDEGNDTTCAPVRAPWY